MAPGVVVNPRNCVVYMMNPNHRIDAVEVSSGALLWSTNNGAKPLMLVGKRLLAQAEPQGDAAILKLVVLDVQRGGSVLLRTQIPMPKGVAALIDQGPGRTFELDARQRADEVEIEWRFLNPRVGGQATSGPAMDVRELEGCVRINVRTGRVGPPASRCRTKNRKVASATVSADGRFVMTTKRGIADVRGLPTYTWEICELDTGMLVGEMPASISYAPFFVCHRKLVFQSPPIRRRVDGRWIEQSLGLRAFDLEHRSFTWSRKLRDTTFRGPLPPRS